MMMFSDFSARRFLIGIDAGGSKSQIAIWEVPSDAMGTHSDDNVEVPEASSWAGVVGRPPADWLATARYADRFEGINLDAITPDEATRRLQAMLSGAAASLQLPLADVCQQAHLVIGMAGLDTELDRQNAQDWLQSALDELEILPSVHLISDVELGLWSATRDGIGIVLIAGTGSNCFGRNAAGFTAKTGGVSHFFSDEGGGFMLGWHGLHLLAKMHDGRIPRTRFYDDVLERYSVTDFAQLKRLVVQAEDTKRTVAKAAPVVQETAAAGDAHTEAIVDQQLDELQQMVGTVIDKLGGNADALPVLLVGGLFRDTAYMEGLQARLAALGVSAQAQHIDTPVIGAVSFVSSQQRTTP